ncbi:MAG: ABC transporter permease [bacterium]|nr:ABC transporter permease [bacterium]
MKREKDGFAFLKDQKWILLLIFIVMNVVFALLSSRFFRLNNYYNMLKQSAMIMITASGATILMMTGNFDLSTGSNLAFTSVLYSLLATNGVPLFPAAAVALLCGALFGVANGTLVVRYNLPPFIATLGMMYVGRGLALISCNGQSIRTNIPKNFDYLARGKIFSVPLPVILIVVFAAIFWIVQRKTLLGKYAMAIGGNRNAVFFSGVNAGAVIFWLYVIVGVLAAFCGVMTASRIGAGDPRTGQIFFFDVIVAILLGGVKLSGGKGSVLGTLLGAMIVAVLANGLNMLNVLPFWQQVLKGIILVLAILMNEKLFIGTRKKALIPQEV